MIVAETARLLLRELTAADAPFLHALLTDPAFLEHIGDRGVHTLNDAARVIPQRYRAGYARDGFGMWLIERKLDATAIGLAGLVRREGLDHVDLGYALLPQARGQGYAREAAGAVVAWATRHGIAPLLAIVSPANLPSIAVLERLGFLPSGTVTLPRDDAPVRLFQKL